MHLSDIQTQVRDMARDFATQTIRPMAEALDREESFPRELYNQMGRLVFLGSEFQKTWGGPASIR